MIHEVYPSEKVMKARNNLAALFPLIFAVLTVPAAAEMNCPSGSDPSNLGPNTIRHIRVLADDGLRPASGSSSWVKGMSS
jgi:hypothetical protein